MVLEVLPQTVPHQCLRLLAPLRRWLLLSLDGAKEAELVPQIGNDQPRLLLLLLDGVVLRGGPRLEGSIDR